MKKNNPKILFLLLIFANLLFADVIYFANGDIDEGIVQTNSIDIFIQTKDKRGSYSVPRNSVV